jgi:DNA-binding XRE family transcriptional regulator
MMFINRIKQLREDFQMPQRQLAAALEIDTATYCKIEKGIRCVKRDQVITIAKILKTNQNELLSLWLADQIINILKDERKLTDIALEMASKQ